MALAYLLERATRAAADLLGAKGAPAFHSITRWAPVLPQYEPGHSALIESIEEKVAKLGAVSLAGNYLRGVGVEGAATSGVAAVSRLLDHLGVHADPEQNH
jgi:protoporphyrinogen oxidase